MVDFRVVHRTEYEYGAVMADGFTVARLLPRSTPTQDVRLARIDVEPQPDEWLETLDSFGNRIVHLAVHHPHRSLRVVSTLEVSVRAAEVPTEDVDWQVVVARAAAARGDIACEIGPALAHTQQTPNLTELTDVVSTSFVLGRGVIEATRALCHEIYSTFTFDPTSTDVSTPLATVLTTRRGVCQDFAHLAVAALRSVGLPARYVSGYIETEPPPGEPKLTGVDASHAWASVWTGTGGWVDFDPTNDQLPPLRHVTVAWGRDYDDVAPVRGVVIGPPSTQSLSVSVDVASVSFDSE